uniref:C2 domain-containing protein n=1 Tax=Trichogramma kaykai TaxID=54128 RepID=A0ABD2VZA0_9HYME
MQPNDSDPDLGTRVKQQQQQQRRRVDIQAAADLLRRLRGKLRRAWTIHSARPLPRQPRRSSSEFRPYRSLPSNACRWARRGGGGGSSQAHGAPQSRGLHEQQLLHRTRASSGGVGAASPKLERKQTSASSNSLLLHKSAIPVPLRRVGSRGDLLLGSNGSLNLSGVVGAAAGSLPNRDSTPSGIPKPRSNGLAAKRREDHRAEEMPSSGEQQQQQQPQEEEKQQQPIPVLRKLSRSEPASSDDVPDDAQQNRRCSSYLSPEASPLSTRSSKYSPRESESEPTTWAPSSHSGTSQRVRDTISRTRRQSSANSSNAAKYESSGSEGVRLEPSLPSYVDIARRCKFFEANSAAQTGGVGGSTDAVNAAAGKTPWTTTSTLSQQHQQQHQQQQRVDSTTSAGEDEFEEHSRAGLASGLGAPQGRVMLRRRRQLDAQGARRRGRPNLHLASSANRACATAAAAAAAQGSNRQAQQQSLQQQQQQQQQQGQTLSEEEAAAADYRRLVFISSDSSSGREEDDADSSCSGSSSLYLTAATLATATASSQNNNPPTTASSSGLDDCDWDYFESNSLKLPPLPPPPTVGAATAAAASGTAAAATSKADWTSCCPGRPGGCCQACGASASAKVLPVPVPIPVPVPVPYPVPASLWQSSGGGIIDNANPIISPREAARLERSLSLSLRPCEQSAGSWFSWNPRFDSAPNLMFPPHQTPIFNAVKSDQIVSSQALEATRQQQHQHQQHHHHQHQNEKLEIAGGVVVGNNDIESRDEEEIETTNETTPEPATEDSGQEQRMFNRRDSSQEQDSRSSCSSGRSSADSSDLEDEDNSSATHHHHSRFLRVLVVNPGGDDDSLTSDNDIEDNDDSDSGHNIVLERVEPYELAEKESAADDSVVLRRIRRIDADAQLDELDKKEEEDDDDDEDEKEKKPKKKQPVVDRPQQHADSHQEIASYDEIYLSSNKDDSAESVLLKSVRSIDPDELPPTAESTPRPNSNNNYQRSVVESADNDSPSSKSSYRTQQFVAQQQQPVIAALEKDSFDKDYDDSSNDSAVMPDSLEVSLQHHQHQPQQQDNQLNDSIEIDERDLLHESEFHMRVVDGLGSALATSSPVEGQSTSCPPQVQGGIASAREVREQRQQQQQQKLPMEGSLSGYGESSTAAATSSGAYGDSSAREPREYATAAPRAPVVAPAAATTTAVEQLDNNSMAKSRKKWQIPASLDIKGLPTTHFLPSPVLQIDARNDHENNEDEEQNENNDDSGSSNVNNISAELEEEQVGVELGAGAGVAASTAAAAAADAAPQATMLEIPPSPLIEVDDEVSYEETAVYVDDDDDKEYIVITGVALDDVVAAGSSSSGSNSVAGICPPQVPSGSVCTAAGSNSQESLERGEQLTQDAVNGMTNSPFPTGRSSLVSAAAAAQNRDWIPTSTNAADDQYNNKYKSLVMINQKPYQSMVNVVTSDTTMLVHQDSPAPFYRQANNSSSGPEAAVRRNVGKKPLPCRRLLPPYEPDINSGLYCIRADSRDDDDGSAFRQRENDDDAAADSDSDRFNDGREKPGPLILEEGLADDDSWVEEISHDEDDAQSASTATDQESSEDEAANNLGDREEELRGYHRQAIDFTLHTIVEESCEESEPEYNTASWRRHALASRSAPELDSLSDASSIMSEGLDSLTREDMVGGQTKSASLDKDKDYYLSDRVGSGQDRRDSDGSVGSDSEGRPSPEAQRRKKLVRARGTGRSHSSSLDNLLALAHQSGGSHQGSLQEGLATGTDGPDSPSEGSSTETDGAEEISANNSLVKQKKKPPQRSHGGAQSPRIVENRTPEPPRASSTTSSPPIVILAEPDELADNASEEDGAKTPRAESVLQSGSPQPEEDASCIDTRARQQSRDSGFVGSCDDLLHSTPQQRNATAAAVAAAASVSTASGAAALPEAASKSSSEEARDQESANNGRSPRDQRNNFHERLIGSARLRERLINIDQQQQQPTASSAPLSGLTRKDSFNNWSSDEETNLMMSKMRQFFKSMVANSANGNSLANNKNEPGGGSTTSSAASPAPSPSPRLSSANRHHLNNRHSGRGSEQQQRAKPPQLVYFENELTRLMKTVPGIRDEQVREIVEYLSSEDTWSDSYDSSDYTSSDLEGAAVGGRRSALREQISQSCQQIINKFDGTDDHRRVVGSHMPNNAAAPIDQPTQLLQQQQQQGVAAGMGRDTAFVYQKLVASFTKMSNNENSSVANKSSDSGSVPSSSPPLIAKVMHHIGSRLVALMHQVTESNVPSSHGSSHRRSHHAANLHNRVASSSASTTEDDDSTSDSACAPSHLPRSKSHDPLILINGHANSGGSSVYSGGAASMPPAEAEEREASDYERFSWRGSFESALMAADSRTKLSLLAGSSGGDMSNCSQSAALAMAAKRRSAGDLLFNPKSCSREQLDRVRSCGSIGGGSVTQANSTTPGGSIEEKIWSKRRRSSVPDNRVESGKSTTSSTIEESGGGSDTGTTAANAPPRTGDDDTDDDHELNYYQHQSGDSRAMTLPRDVQAAAASAASPGNGTTNSLPRQGISSSASPNKSSPTVAGSGSNYHFLQQHNTVKSARYRPPGFSRTSPSVGLGPKRAFSAPGLQVQGPTARSRRQHQQQQQHQQGLHSPAGNASSSANISANASISDEASSLSEACSTPIIGSGSRRSHHQSPYQQKLHNNSSMMNSSSQELDEVERSFNTTRASLSSLGVSFLASSSPNVNEGWRDRNAGGKNLQARSDSMASVYSGAGEGRWCGSVAVRGEVEFSLQYDYKQLNLEVHVTQCRDLAPVDVKRNRSDPYVKVYLLPDKSKSGKRKTKVKKHTLNPVFDETLKFTTSLNGLESRTLWLTVWHSDMFGRNDFLGEVRMPLENKIFDDPRPQWYPLQERTEPFDDPVVYKGEVIVGLKFVPPDPSSLDRDRDSNELLSKFKKTWSKGSLHVLVKEARNLQTRTKHGGTCDPFCKSYLLPDKGRSGKQKTGVVRRSAGSPVWNHTFVYKDISLQELADRGLELTVWDHDRIGSNEFLGGVRFNLGTSKHYGKVVDWMDATGRELSLWQSMLERPNFWVEGAVTLRPNLHNHKTGAS